jgi:hypothetical protein
LIAVILQPSYIPWRGYFDQIRRAETFIFYDDVQYDKHGWRNRNQIKTAAGKQWLTIPVHSAGVTAGIPIKDVRIDWSKPWVRNHLKALETSYSKAPFYRKHAPLLESIYSRHDELIADFTVETTKLLAGALGIHTTRFLRSSQMKRAAGRKTERLIQILQEVGAKHYLSGPSARDYIDAEAFTKAGITLEYMKYEFPEYPQLYPPFEPNVSVLDLLFMTGERALRYIGGGETAADES